MGGRAEVIERRCIPKDYTDGKDQGCLIMDEIRDNLQYEYSSYYFYFDAIVIDAPACFCSEDVCDCDIDTCTTKGEKSLWLISNDYGPPPPPPNQTFL